MPFVRNVVFWCRFNLQCFYVDNIIGKIEIFQPDLHAEVPGTISTKSEANLTFVIHDPHNYFDNYSLYYAWSVNYDIVSFDVNVRYNFSKPERYDIMLMVTAINGIKPMYYTSLSMQLNAKGKSYNKLVKVQKDLTVLDIKYGLPPQIL